MSNKQILLAATSMVALLGVTGPETANAHTLVSSIFGVYDAQCGSNTDCTLGTGDTSVIQMTGTGSTGYAQGYDTPSLFIDNPTSTAMTGATLTLTGFQGFENGTVSSLSLPDIAAHTILDVDWSDPQAKGDLFSFDYDDLSFSYGNPVGNFDVHFSASLGSTAIAADFSPVFGQGGSNVAGTFVGWEGLDPNGISETSYDAHNGTVSGPLAYIYTGTTGRQNAVPEPLTLSLFGAGVGALSLTRRKRKKS